MTNASTDAQDEYDEDPELRALLDRALTSPTVHRPRDPERS